MAMQIKITKEQTKMNFFNTQTGYPQSHHALTQDAINEVAWNTKAPPEMVAMEFGCCMGLVTQSLYEVRMPTGAVRPLSLNWLVIADSGERKTAVHKLVAKPIYDFDKKTNEQYKLNLEEYKADMNAWKAVESGLRQKIKKLAQEEGDA